MSTHPFLTAAETRAAHLREIDKHMSALGIREARLADVQREIPELEAAMTVYRRLSDGAAPAKAPRDKAPARRSTPAAVSAPAARRQRRAPEPPSFKEFALNQLDSLAAEADEPAPLTPQSAFA